ncbi:malto-oligosyltrehalose trehalohydrolase [Pedobacter sp. SYSU D00535]|uniref:malto-oligosyltrehalose trehalohydrolase n=1 Tax=Pedobacter sp. SYSU D00535 TaxID=2810308 RepID=UPI001A97811A|nr:malto-oligosyltrehalose trehalohydrolase [Pedobacter sp. SYSU D00535]
MNQLNITKRSLGVNFTSGGQAEILVWAPKAKQVELLLTDSQQKISLEEQEFGYWTAKTATIKPGDKYSFLLDGEKERPDPASLQQEETVHGPSIAFDLKAFKWDDQDWNNQDLEDYILYELHTGTFTEEGTFAGIEQKLDYLKELGVNAIEIMPVAQFPGGRNWGYDGVLPYATQNTYGGPEALQRLVQACHKAGIAVVLDVVYNHMGPEGNYLGDFGHYFTEKYNTPWGNALNFDDAWCDGVRQYFIENVLMWFRDFHIDALRMDAVHAIKDFSPVHILREIKLRVDELMKETGRRHYLIVELDLNDTRFINPLSEQGFGMDAQWIDEFHHALRVTAGEERNGYYSDFTGITHLAKSYQDAYVYDGQFSPHRQKTFGIKAESNPGKQFIVFSQNHDQVGNRMLGERTSQLVSFDMQKLMAGAVLVSPYLPMLFMGEEYAETHPFLYFVSHTDTELAEAVRKGRKAEFAAFHAEGEAPDPVSEETFNESKLQWQLLTKDPHATMFSFYKKLIQLRKELPALHRLNRKLLQVEADEASQTLSLLRSYENQHVFVAMNFSQQEQDLKTPNGYKWKNVLNSAAPEWGGTATAPAEIEGGATLSVPPESILIYTY